MFALPDVIEIEPTMSCNIRCRMCHVSFMPVEQRPILGTSLIDKLSALRGAHFIIGSGFEPTMNPGLADMLARLACIGAGVELVTNATIVSDKLLGALLDCDVRLITVSFDGIRKETYEYIRRGADFEATLRNIRRVRRAFAGRDTLFAVNTTMMRCNLPEIPEIVDFWDREDFDLVRFISMVVREKEPELVRESLYPVRHEYYRLLEEAAGDVMTRPRRIGLGSKQLAWTDVPRRYPDCFRQSSLVSTHPAARRIPYFRQDPQVGQRPGMWFGCKSPWTFAKILNTGDVQLCYQYTIGNLHQASFEEIWNGPAAQRVREQVAEDRRICPACDYFRFCLSQEVNSEELKNYFAGPLLDELGRVNFETGQFEAETAGNPPQLAGAA